MQTYFVMSTNPDGEDESLFVRAADVPQATELWRGAYDVEPTAEPLRVFVLPRRFHEDSEYVLGWHTQVLQVGGTLPVLPPG